MAPRQSSTHPHSKNPIALGFGVAMLVSGCEAVQEDEYDVESRVATSVIEIPVELEQEVMLDMLPSDVEIGAIKRHSVDGQMLTLVKYFDKDGNIEGLILDADGEWVDPSTLPTVAPDKIGRTLRALLDDSGIAGDLEDEPIDVVIGLIEPPFVAERDEWVEQSSASIDDRGNVEVAINGSTLTPQELERIALDRQARVDAHVARLVEGRRELLRELGARHPSFTHHRALREAIDRGDASVTLPLRLDEMEAFLADNEDIVVGLELYDRPVDLLAGAMLDTRVDPYAIGYAGRRGAGIGVYMSETGCPDVGHITNYTRLSGSSDAHNKNVSAIVRGVSPESHVYCRGGYVLPSAADLLGYGGAPRIHVETHSWGYVESDNDDYRLADRDFDNHVYDTAVSVFTANGNFGNNNGYTASPAKAVNVISVGNYDDSFDTINSSSSFTDSEIGNKKPELSAPGTNICAGGWCMTGTSQASPHAAAFAADLLGAYPLTQLRPHLLKAVMLAGNDKSVTGGLDKIGLGGLDFYRAAFNGHMWAYEGANNSYAGFDAGDYLPNNGSIDLLVYLDAAQTNARLAISWLNSGTFTYNHRLDLHPLGMDLDICVYDPNGVQKGCSSSFDDPFELVSFDPTVTGSYRIKITRYSNNDVSSKFHMGFVADWK